MIRMRFAGRASRRNMSPRAASVLFTRNDRRHSLVSSGSPSAPPTLANHSDWVIEGDSADSGENSSQMGSRGSPNLVYSPRPDASSGQAPGLPSGTMRASASSAPSSFFLGA